MNRSLLVLLGAVSLSACAQTSPPATAAKPGAPTVDAAVAAAGTPEARVRAALHAINPTVEIDQISPAPLKGFQEAIVGGQPVYVSDDGRYLVQGTLYDIASRTNLGEASMAKLRVKLRFTKGALQAVAADAQKHKSGARGLRATIREPRAGRDGPPPLRPVQESP